MVKWFISLLAVAAIVNAGYTGPQTLAQAPVLPKTDAPMYQPHQSYLPQPQPQQQPQAPQPQPQTYAPQAPIPQPQPQQSYVPLQQQPQAPQKQSYSPQQSYNQPQQAPPRPSFDCLSKSDGLYELGRCQGTYIQCLYGEASFATCPANLVFDNDRCNYKNDCLNPTQPPPPPQQQPPAQQAYAPAPAPQYQAPVSGYARQQQFISYGQQPVQQAPPKPKETYCQQNNLIEGYHAPGCSHVYYACYPVDTIKLTCPGGLFYDTELNQCDYRHLIKSCGGSRPLPPPPAQNPPMSPYAPQPQSQPQTYAAPVQQQPPAPQPQTYAAPVQQQPPAPQPQTYAAPIQQQPPAPQPQTYAAPVQQQPPAPQPQTYAAPIQQQPPAPQPQTYAAPVQQQPPAPQPQTYAAPVQQQPPAPQPQTYAAPVQQQPPAPQPQTYAAPIQQQPPAPQPQTYAAPIQQQPPAPQPQTYAAPVQQQLLAPSPYASVQQTPPKPAETFCKDRSLNDGFYGRGCSSQFYVCALGQTTRLDCPQGLFYDQDINECGHKSTIVKCGGQKPTQPPPAQQPPKSSPYGQAPPARQPPPPPEFDCSSKQDGIYLRGCSSKYFVCVQGAVTALSCPSGTFYSAFTEMCDYKSNVVECGGIAPTKQPIAQNPIMIPQSPYGRRPEQPPQQQPGPSYGQSQAPAQQAPPKSNNPCATLTNGIYGRKCSRFFFVCATQKTYDFICPKDHAFNLRSVKCAPKVEISTCPDFEPTPAPQQQPAAPQPQQSYAPQPQPQQPAAPQPQQSYAPQPQQQQPAAPQPQQSYAPQPQQQQPAAPQPQQSYAPRPQQQQPAAPQPQQSYAPQPQQQQPAAPQPQQSYAPQPQPQQQAPIPPQGGY